MTPRIPPAERAHAVRRQLGAHLRSLLAAAATGAAVASHGHAQAALDSAGTAERVRGGPRAVPAPAARRPLDAAIALRAGTLGAGVEVGKLVTNHLAVRAGYFRTPLHLVRTIADVRYDARVQLQGASAFADLFPASRGAFHLTAGAVLNGPRVTGSALPASDGTVALNGRRYTEAELGRLTGTVAVRRLAPYVGVGFGTPARGSRVALTTDVGVMLGAPTLTLDATGAARNPELRADLAAQQDKTQRDMNRYGRVVPVTSLGLAVRF